MSPRELSRLSNILLFLIISFAPTDVAIILSLGKIGLGSIRYNFSKLKFLIALAQAPIFSDVAKCYPLKVSIWDVDQKFLKGINPSTLSNYNRNHGIK